MQDQETGTSGASEAINEIRRFVWAAGDMIAAQEKTADRLELVRGEFVAARDALSHANNLARQLAQRGMSISRQDMDAFRIERIALADAMHQTIGEAERIRERFWLGALGLGLIGGLIGGGITIAAPLIIRGIMP